MRPSTPYRGPWTALDIALYTVLLLIVSAGLGYAFAQGDTDPQPPLEPFCAPLAAYAADLATIRQQVGFGGKYRRELAAAHDAYAACIAAHGLSQAP